MNPSHPASTASRVEDFDEIGQVMKTLLDGESSNDAAKLEAVFHPDARMFGQAEGQRDDIPIKFGAVLADNPPTRCRRCRQPCPARCRRNVMDTVNSATVTNASSATLGTVQSAASMSVLKKALSTQAASTAQLIASLPTPALATEGPVGTQLNTYA